jgi:hypothetical protein
MKNIIAALLLVAGIASFSSCKKCYNCVHPDGAAGGYPDREICGKGLIGKAAVEADRSNLVYEGYSCR